MSHPWAARIPLSDADVASRLRLLDGIQFLAAAPWFWLRGESLDERLDLQLRGLPGAERFRVLPDFQLVPAGRQVPTDVLPQGRWQPLRGWASVELPATGFPANVVATVPLTVVRGTDEAEASLLTTSFPAWSEYAISAPQVRLERWRFAVSRDGRALIRGTPLPPIPGERFVESEGVAIRAGWRCDPRVDAPTLRSILRVEPHSVALIHPDGTWEQIPGSGFVRATRSAVRASVPTVE